MTLQDYITKYGEVSGTKRFNGVQKLLKSREENYSKQPYKRLTREWFIWRYPEDGLERFNDHVNKSRQSEENMIARWGEEEGKKKWKETVEKKDTNNIIREKKGDAAVEEVVNKRKEAAKRSWDLLATEEKQTKIKKRTNKALQTKKERYGNKTKLEIYLEKYGDEGHIEYAKYLQRVFKSIGYSKEAEELIKSIIHDNSWLTNYDLYYRDSADASKCEWFISDKKGVKFYDFCVKDAMAILEYDGARWHPTETQAISLKDELMEITKISFSQKFKDDQTKVKMAIKGGFRVFVIRSDFTNEQKEHIIKEFISYIKCKLTLN